MMDKKSNFQWLPVWPWEHEFDQFKQKKEKKNTQWSVFFQSPQMKVRRHSKEQSRLYLMLYYLIIYIIPVLGRVQSRIQSNLKKRGEIGKKTLQSFVQWHFLLYQTEVFIKKKKWSVSEITYILCTQEDEPPEHGSGKNWSHWLTPFLTLCESGRWERIQHIFANRPSSAPLWNQLVVRMPSFIECPVMAFSGQILAFRVLTS